MPLLFYKNFRSMDFDLWPSLVLVVFIVAVITD